MPPIHILIKPVSGLCNMRCKYCFYCDEIKKREQESYGFMSEETLRQVIQKGIESAEKECTFAFQGGEPTLRGLEFFRLAVAYQKQYNTKGLIIHNALQTNGYIINDEWCEFFEEYKFLIGLSVDGTMKTHDMNRLDHEGAGTFLKCMKAAELLKKYQVDFNILTVVNRQTAPKIRKIYQEYEKRGFSFQQYIACLDPLFEEAGQKEYSLSPRMYGEFLTELFDMWYGDLKNGKQPYIRMFENYIDILLGYPPESCEQNGICGLQNVIEADGSVYPCDFYMLDKYRLGSLKDESFQQIQEKRKKIQFVEESKHHSKMCERCQYFEICRGGCRRHRVPDGKGGYINYFCEAYLILFDKYYQTMQNIAAKLQKQCGI